jgi:hypothetical protein
MAQMGFFDAEKRLTRLSAKGDSLVGLSALVPWESFRGDIEAVVLTADEAKKSPAGRKPIDALELFRMLGAAVAVQSVGLADRVSGPRPAFVHALCRAGLRERYSGRHYALAVPREAGEGGLDRQAVRALRPAS